MQRWSVRLAKAAEQDFEDVIEWTVREFGARQALTYANSLIDAIDVLTGGPEVVGVRARDDIGAGLYSLHVARQRRRGRHWLVFRISNDAKHTIELLRILHDSMDIVRHVP
jgi:toxin ParE1/3/4